MRTLFAILFSLGGLGFCILAALGKTDAVCVSQGCALFKGTAVFGIGLYWIGALAFLILAATMAVSRKYALLLLGVGLVIDIGLLLLQAVTLSCVNCLIVAALLGLSALFTVRRKTLGAYVLGAWFLAFAAALPGLAGEGFGPVPLHEGVEPAARVFFSPTCPACRILVERLSETAPEAKNISLYPVSKNDEDTARLYRLAVDLDKGEPLFAALGRCFEESADMEAASFSDTLHLTLISFRNKVFLVKAGATSVPYVMTGSTGLSAFAPKAPRPDPAPAQAASPEPDAPPAAPGSGTSGFLENLAPKTNDCDFDDPDCR